MAHFNQTPTFFSRALLIKLSVLLCFEGYSGPKSILVWYRLYKHKVYTIKTLFGVS